MEVASYTNCAVGLAVDLVNTHSVVSGRDDLPNPQALAAFLAEHKFSYHGPIDSDDLAGVVNVRARLRAVFDSADERVAAAAVNCLLEDSQALPELTNHDGEPWHLHFTRADRPLAERLGAEAAMGLAVVIDQEGFDRLRVCDGHGCADVFVDISRNRSRRYCSPTICGNRASVAAYRARQKASIG